MAHQCTWYIWHESARLGRQLGVLTGHQEAIMAHQCTWYIWHESVPSAT